MRPLVSHSSAGVRTGASIFLTGEPGSGKTHTVNRYVRELQRQGIDYAYTASTGIAATHGHGVTIHAWSGIGVRETLNARDLDTLAANRRLATRIERTQVLVIDEISMLPARSLTLVDTVCRHIRGVPSPFGGLQVVLVGDFFQLPPVVRREAQAGMLPLGDGEDPFGAEFAHASSAWRDLAPTVCYLSEQHRQSDKPFLDLLAAIRANACSGIHRERQERAPQPAELARHLLLQSQDDHIALGENPDPGGFRGRYCSRGVRPSFVVLVLPAEDVPEPLAGVGEMLVRRQ